MCVNVYGLVCVSAQRKAAPAYELVFVCVCVCEAINSGALSDARDGRLQCAFGGTVVTITRMRWHLRAHLVIFERRPPVASTC